MKNWQYFLLIGIILCLFLNLSHQNKEILEKLSIVDSLPQKTYEYIILQWDLDNDLMYLRKQIDKLVPDL